MNLKSYYEYNFEKAFIGTNTADAAIVLQINGVPLDWSTCTEIILQTRYNANDKNYLENLTLANDDFSVNSDILTLKSRYIDEKIYTKSSIIYYDLKVKISGKYHIYIKGTMEFEMPVTHG